ncbi:MAG: sodium:proton antiporter [Lachnospiraceae bacterium]|nr:sodium:proton antiporter [Lachnospiraceae bacterium]
MEFIRNFPLFSIVLSLFSGVLCTMLKGRHAKNYTAAFEGLLIAMTAAVLIYTNKEGASFTYVMGEFPAPWGNEIRAGVLEALIALIFLTVVFCSVLAGWRFLQIDVDESKLNLYFSIINLLTAALLAMTYTNDIFTGYVFIEILTLTSCGLIVVREIGRTTLAAIRYMILNLVGSGLFLLGVVLLYDITGHLLMVPMHEKILLIAESGVGMQPLTLAVGVITIGLGIKSGLFPFYLWMPDTYGWSTPSSGAILSAVVSKCYIFLLIKIYLRVIGTEVLGMVHVPRILFVLGIFGMVFGSLSAIRKKSINRMIAFSSAAQIGYIYMGIGLGGVFGYTAAIFQIIAHCVTKSLLFLASPRLAEVSGDSLLFKNLQGSAFRAKWAGGFFIFGSLSMIGIPIFAGFTSKLLFGLAGADCGQTSKFILTMLALAVSSVLNALYFIRTVIRIYSRGESGMKESVVIVPTAEGKIRTIRHGAEDDEKKYGAWSLSQQLTYVLPCLILLAVNLMLGLFAWVFVDLIERGLLMFF